MKQEKYTIEHLGKSFSTIHFDKDLSDEDCERIRMDFYSLPDFETEVVSQIMKIRKTKKVDKIINYYIKELMYKAKSKIMKWTVEEFMKSNDLIRFVSGRIKSNPSFFKDNDFISNFKTVLRAGNSKSTQIIPNFPFQEAKKIIEKYNTNGNYYDFSCGWGIRVLASISNNVNYFGTDPNTELTKRIKMMINDIGGLIKIPSVDIRTQGSEFRVPEWENKMGLAFSSPPYFDLEIYDVDGFHFNYEDWLEKYWRPTTENIKFYLIDEGYFLLNIKSINGYDLLEDMKKIAIESGFIFEGYETLKVIQRPRFIKLGKNMDERILVFKKTQKKFSKKNNLLDF